MTQFQFHKRLQSLGASEGESELIAARYFGGYWMDAPAFRMTAEQRNAMLTLIADRRQEDEEQAWITHEAMTRWGEAGYHVDWRRL